jgi:hypothetical protein
MYRLAFDRPVRVKRGTLLLALLVMLGMVVVSPSRSRAKIWGDVGDAPDSSNHAGIGMTAYPWTTSKAAFPTVFDPYLAGNTPPGPIHLQPLADAWLGKSASSEADADMGYDEDGVDNIKPSANVANKDGYDDGLIIPGLPSGLLLPQCGKTSFSYVVTAPNLTLGHSMIVNAWFDFNRDGDWSDTLYCQVSPSGPTMIVYEWAVQNQVVGVTSGSHTITTPNFMSTHPGGHRAVWMRLTLSESKAPTTSTALPDGRGPREGFQYGETEDYYLNYCVECVGAAYYGGP